MLHALLLVHNNQFEVFMYSTLLTVGFHGLFFPGELAMSEHVILAANVHIGTNKEVIILPTSKANCSHMAQHITINSYSTACPIKALTAYALIFPKRPGQFFVWLRGNPVLTQDIACILNKLLTFLNLPQQLIKLHFLHIGGSTHLYLSSHSLKHIQDKGRWSSLAFQRYIRCQFFSLLQQRKPYGLSATSTYRELSRLWWTTKTISISLGILRKWRYISLQLCSLIMCPQLYWTYLTHCSMCHNLLWCT